MAERGKLIVIEGTDGSGKATQTSLLIEKLRYSGHNVEAIDFPRHGDPSAKLVDLYLNGFFGESTEVDPKFVSSFYAIDRLLNKEKIENWLHQGKTVVADRYVTSNMGHQGAKIGNEKDRKTLFEFINNLEYNEMGLPKPDIVIYLHVPTDIAFKLIENKNKRDYIKGKTDRDGHEKDINYLKNAENSYLHASQLFGWKIVHCTENEALLSIEAIHEKVWNIVSDILKK